MTYIAEGISTQKAKLNIKLQEQQKEANDALTAYQLAQQEETRAKKKRGLFGKILGAVAVGVLAVATGGLSLAALGAMPTWGYALGYAVGGGLGNLAYDQDWNLFSQRTGYESGMEDTLASLDLLEEQTQFKDIRENLEQQTDLYDIEVDEFKTTSEEFFTEGSVDFLAAWATLASLEGAGKTLGDVIKPKVPKVKI